MEKQGKETSYVDTAKKVVGAAAGIAVVAYGIASLFAASATTVDAEVDTRKKMKAPGKNGEVMYRDDFESDPASHFRSLREKDDTRKEMKAPGKKGEYMYRDDFARDPASHFRSLREK